MPEQTKVLGQAEPSAATLTTIYTVTTPVTGAVISSLVVCNLDAAETEFRIAVSPAGASIINRHYQFYDRPIPGVDSYIATIGIGLEIDDVVRVYCTLATVVFTLHGMEIT